MIPPFKFFKSHPGRWRVDGISCLSMEDGKRPRVIICFSKDGEHASGSVNFFQKNLHFSAIMWFTTGSIWENGRKVSNPKIQKPVATDTRTSRTRILRNTLRIVTEEENGTEVDIIPVTEFSFGGGKGNYRHLMDTKYEVLKTTDEETPYIIIPHSEIYRFYLAVSTRLCNAILMDDVDRYVDLDKSIPGPSPTLVTNRRLSRVERYIFLRALSDEKAMLSMRHVRKCLEKSSYERKGNYLEATFPFKGMTNLTCAGQRICWRPATDHYPAIYALFAMQLLSCSYTPNLYDPTIVYPEAKKSRKESDSSGGSYDKGSEDEPSQQDMDELFELGDTPADAKIRRLVLRVPSYRFPAMTDLKYSFENLDGSEDARGRWLDENEESDSNTIGEGDYSQENSGAKGVDRSAENQRTSRDMENFIKMMRVFKQKNKAKNWEVEFLSNTDELVAEGERLSSFPQMTGRYSWYLIKPEGETTPRARHAVCAQITSPNNNKIYLVEIELRPNESGWSTAVWIPSVEGGSFEVSDLNSFLKLTAIRKRWPKEGHDWGRKEWKILADELLAKSTIYGADHPHGVKEYEGKDIQKWAEDLSNKIDSFSTGLTF